MDHARVIDSRVSKRSRACVVWAQMLQSGLAPAVGGYGGNEACCDGPTLWQWC